MKKYKLILPENQNTYIYGLILFSFLIKVLFSLIFSNLHNEYYWEYGEIAKNIIAGKGFSFFSYSNGEIIDKFVPNGNPYPSAYMPAGYVFFLIPFLLIKEIVIRNILLLIVQAILSCLTGLLLYNVTKKYFNYKVAMLSMILYLFIPEFIYSVISFTPTIIYHLLLMMLLLFLDRDDKKYIVLIGLLMASIIFMRSEFLLFALLFVFSLIYKKSYYKASLISLTLVLCLSPWLIRNYMVFEQYTPLTTNFGYHLFRGNNNGEMPVLEEKIFTEHQKFEPLYMGAFQEKAINYILNNKTETVLNSFKKVFELWIFDLRDKRALNILYVVPSIFILLTFLVGFFKNYSYKKYKYFIWLFVITTVTIMIFIPLPRYQTMMKILLLPFSSYAAITLLEHFSFKQNLKIHNFLSKIKVKHGSRSLFR